MDEEEINAENLIDSRNNVHSVPVQWKKGLWSYPKFKLMEATTRKELGKLNAGV
jgi:hypothetical protein